MKKLILIPLTAISTLLLIFTCFACGKEKNMEPTSYGNNPPKDTTGNAVSGLQYLALGDSYTIGQSVPETDRFPAQTAQLVASESINIKTINYIAATGWTTANLISAISAQNPSANYDIVTLLIGVNDQYQHMDTVGYRTRFTALLNTSVALAANKPSRVFVLSIPDYSATPFVSPEDKVRVSAEIDAFNAINKQITLAHNISYTDITPASRRAANDPSLIANDGLHPSGKQYTNWAYLLAPVIKSVLK